MPKRSKKKGLSRVLNGPLKQVLYCYLEPRIYQQAKAKGIKTFGSTSAYINYLIAKDVNDLASVQAMEEYAAKVFGTNLA